jgi:hypothetical protein
MLYLYNMYDIFFVFSKIIFTFEALLFYANFSEQE